MKKILLMGNPNVGKSAVFSRLTGARVISSNYPGTTVEFTEGKMDVEGRKAVLIDVPGAYDLGTSSQAEEIAVDMLEDGDVVINVVDAVNLERSLGLTLRLLERNTPRGKPPDTPLVGRDQRRRDQGAGITDSRGPLAARTGAR